MRRDPGQVALLELIHWLPSIVWAEQLILVPVSLLGQVLWSKGRGRLGGADELSFPSPREFKLGETSYTVGKTGESERQQIAQHTQKGKDGARKAFGGWPSVAGTESCELPRDCYNCCLVSQGG